MSFQQKSNNMEDEASVKLGTEGVNETSFTIPMIEQIDPIVERGVIGAPVSFDYADKYGGIEGVITDIYFFKNRTAPHVNQMTVHTDSIPGEEFATIENIDGELRLKKGNVKIGSMSVPEYDESDFMSVPKNVAGWELLFSSPWGAMWCSPPEVTKETEYRTIEKFNTVSIFKPNSGNEWVCVPAKRNTSSFKVNSGGWHTFDEENILAYAVDRMERKPQGGSSMWFRGLRNNEGRPDFDAMTTKKTILNQYNF